MQVNCLLSVALEMNEDDVLRRTIIQQLSCQFELDFKAIEKEYGVHFSDYFALELEELKAMQADGLLSVSANDIKVSPSGRMLIRNICMVFDEHLRQQTTVQNFSKVI